MNLNTLSLELTTHCQQNCLHCFARSEGMEFTHMPIEQAFEIIEEGRSLEFDSLHLTGGEVLLYPDFFQVIDQAVEKGYLSFFINTNGHLLDKEKAERLSEYQKVEVSLSLNGPEKHHDTVRGEGAQEAALRGLEQALDYNIPVHIFTLVNKHNFEEMPRFAAKLFEDYSDVKDLTFIQLRSGPDDAEDKVSPENYVALVRMTALLGLGGYPVQILENPLSTAAALKMGYTHVPPSHPISRAGRILVFADGSIGDNHSSLRRFGHYVPGKLKEVYHSEAFKAVWTDGDELCRSCPHMEACRKGGLLKPSDAAHNTPPYDVPFCRKVMDLL